jgi:hypothetical protein
MDRWMKDWMDGQTTDQTDGQTNQTRQAKGRSRGSPDTVVRKVQGNDTPQINAVGNNNLKVKNMLNLQLSSKPRERSSNVKGAPTGLQLA